MMIRRGTTLALAMAFVLSSSLAPHAVARADEESASWRNAIKPFLEDHCIHCHDGADAEASLDLAQLDGNLNDSEARRRWVLMHDRIAAGEMPPKDEPQPSKAKVAKAIATLAQALNEADRDRNSVVLRRLNRNEYQNTIRDLFDVDVQVKELLPDDTPSAGFDNVGAGLAVSAETMAAYLQAADAALDAAFGPPKKPRYIKHTTTLQGQTNHDGTPRLATQFGKMFRKTDDGVVIFQSGYCPTNLVTFGRLRAKAGTYRGTLRVRAVQSDKPVTLRIYGGDTVVGRREKHLVGYYDVPPDKWTTIEFTDRLVEDGGTYQPKCYGTRDTRKDADTYPEPGIEIGEITIEGPLEPWPPASRAKLLGGVDPSSAGLNDVDKILTRVLPLAFRRKIDPSEVEPFLGLAESAMDKGRSFEEALRLSLKAVLCSPDFLFLDEPGREFIGQFALASRLSYCLWSSTPDAELLSLASQGKLNQPTVLRDQVDRLLNDSKSKAFTNNFTGQWLDLRDIDFTSPDMKLYPEFDELLKISMLKETHRFFRELIDEDLSLMNFIDSDFCFVNERLAKHYGIDGVTGQLIRKVKLPEDSVRGGLMTQASILKVTANGTNTSPVLRGVWIMENILGQTAPPQPANAPSVEPDTRGATTIREQLASHRNVQSCAVCHVKIDPAGFALENFNPIGGWQENYRTLGEGKRPDLKQSPFTYRWISYRIGLPVDATGQTPDGKPFRDIREFKQIVLNDKKAVAAGIVKKLLTYATGRGLGFSDRPAVADIVDKAAGKNYGLRSCIHEIVQSQVFRQP